MQQMKKIQKPKRQRWERVYHGGKEEGGGGEEDGRRKGGRRVAKEG